jgi:hypothetical protein
VPSLGEPILGASAFGEAILDEDRDISALIGKPETLVCRRVSGHCRRGKEETLGMPRLADALLASRGVVAFWVVSAAALVLMLCAVSAGSTLQDISPRGYQLDPPPLASCSMSRCAEPSPIGV